MHSEREDKARLIKRYGNRKLYDVETSQYITLDGIRGLVRAGENVRVVDNESGDDLTRLTLAQIIYEEEKRKTGELSLPMLRWLVERSDEAMRDFRRSMEKSREAIETVVESTEKKVHEFVEKSSDRSRAFLEEILHAPQRQFDRFQQRIDEQVDRVANHPAVQKEVRRIEENIRTLEQRLQKLTGKKPGSRAEAEPPHSEKPPTPKTKRRRKTAASTENPKH